MDNMIQPPLVDTTSCLCKANPGHKSITDTKKFTIPGAKLCQQSNIRPSIRSKSQKPSQENRNKTQSPLLPRLPDDLAIACLIRVPRMHHSKLRLVCKRWYRLLSGNFFYSLRKRLNVAEEWIYIMKRDKDGKISWHAFDPVYRLYQPLPPVPKEYSEALGFGSAVLGDCHLYLFGGKDPLMGSMRRVIFYNGRTNKWHRAPDMIQRRHFFGSCAVNNCLYVAGGENEGSSLRSGEVYDPNKNRWSFISDMSISMVPFIGVVYEGRWFLKGIGPRMEVVSEVYHPESDTWSLVYDAMVAGWRNPSASLDGKLYALECKDGCKIRVYEEKTKSWSRHMDSKSHFGYQKAFEAVALVAVNGKLCIIRNNMCLFGRCFKSRREEGCELRAFVGDDIWERAVWEFHRQLLFKSCWQERIQKPCSTLPSTSSLKCFRHMF